jgi:hypothetical protein
VKWRAVGSLGVVAFAAGSAGVRALPHTHTVNGGWPDDVRFVLIAKQRIPEGTPGSFVFSQSMYGVQPFSSKELEDGAICSPTT